MTDQPAASPAQTSLHDAIKELRELFENPLASVDLFESHLDAVIAAALRAASQAPLHEEEQAEGHYIPERDGRRCVEHPKGDHELVCLTCMEASQREQEEALKSTFDPWKATREALAASPAPRSATYSREEFERDSKGETGDRLAARTLEEAAPRSAEERDLTDKEKHLLDVYQELGVRWGDDIFAAIKALREPVTASPDVRHLIAKWISEANNWPTDDYEAITGIVSLRRCARELEAALLASERPALVCPHCQLPPVLPDVCTPELHAIIEANIARDWDLFNRGYDHGKQAAAPAGEQP